ncbi:uncharacterized protein LOC129226145 [Uloborus diversus]|uniref:uncharacterized protein LOC129226145 n=1 Tax=Uloborus diversus TaxID=327109 RepID=UPI002408FA1B|nr:uncharacterized protein LOC129226145 [Uloborus diversus]
MKHIFVLAVVGTVFVHLVSAQNPQEQEEAGMADRALFCDDQTADIRKSLVRCMKSSEYSKVYSDFVLECHPGLEKYTVENLVKYTCEASDDFFMQKAECDKQALQNSKNAEEIGKVVQGYMMCFVFALSMKG